MKAYVPSLEDALPAERRVAGLHAMDARNERGGTTGSHAVDRRNGQRAAYERDKPGTRDVLDNPNTPSIWDAPNAREMPNAEDMTNTLNTPDASDTPEKWDKPMLT